jgi:hypothetical protein
MRTFTRECPCCGATFTAKHQAAKWCSSRCSMRAYQRRRRGAPEADLGAALVAAVVQPQILDDVEMPVAWAYPEPIIANGLESRYWRGTPIERRQADGFVNATAICKANGREWSTYARSERTKEYIAALQSVPQFCRTELVQSIWGGQPHLQGTWIHPRLAIDLARWISPAFAVWMDGWFLESLTPALQPTRQPLEPGVHVVAASQRGAAMIWHEVITAEVASALGSLSPAWKHEDRLPLSHRYTFTPAT